MPFLRDILCVPFTYVRDPNVPMPFLRDILRVPFTYVRDVNVHTPHLDKQAQGLVRNHEGVVTVGGFNRRWDSVMGTKGAWRTVAPD